MIEVYCYFLCKERDYLKVKPNGVHSVRTEMNEIFQCPYGVEMDVTETNGVRQEDINVV